MFITIDEETTYHETGEKDKRIISTKDIFFFCFLTKMYINRFNYFPRIVLNILVA